MAIDSFPVIFPDYKGVTIPCNISALNFEVPLAKSVYVEISCGNKHLLSIECDKNVTFPMDKWSNVLKSCAGESLLIELSVYDEQHPNGVRYKPFNIYVSKDCIDPYIVYRLIEPGYESWQEMQICQRALSDFTEQTILKTDRNACINCHSFHNYSPDHMMLHYRKKSGGTLFLENGKMRKVDFKSLPPNKQGVYPMWHPSGKYVVYSSNATVQSFYVTGKSPIEVYDSSSDLILYSLADNKMIIDNRLCNDSLLQTFPAWAPDGKSLYFCVARPQKSSDNINALRYSLCKVGFDANSGTFSDRIDTLINAEKEDISISFPRVSPDGRYLLFTTSAYATFPIWHSDAELKMIDLYTGNKVETDILNSQEADSYHSWSSNGRWIVFSSRRIDGRYTRLFIAHFDGKGHFSRPFLLPQPFAENNTLRLESYNIPEFVKSPVKLDKKQVMELFK